MDSSSNEEVTNDEVHASFLAMDGIANRRAAQSDGSLSWVAPEYEQHAKNAKWYAGLLLGVAISSAIIYLFTRDWMSPIFVVGIAALAWYYARHKPEDKNFTLDTSGLGMGKNYYPIDMFKSFAVDTTTSNTPNIVLYPLRRLVPPITLNCPADMLQQILTLLGNVLPVENHTPTRFDLMISKIKF